MVRPNRATNIWIKYGIGIIVIVFLFILLNMLHRNQKTQKEEPKQQVIVIDSTKPLTSSSGYNPVQNENKGVPVYPGSLPKYSNSHQPLDYQQIGILTSNETDKEPVVLPLFGRKVYGRSDRWQYYTATDKNNMMRVPLKYGSRDCEDDVGCQEIYTGDKLTVDIYQGREFTATVYKTDSPKYFSSPY